MRTNLEMLRTKAFIKDSRVKNFEGTELKY